MLPTCRVHCAVFDNDGSPISGAVVTARLDRFEVYQGYVVPDIETATTDATGACVLALWPNALGATASSYAVKIVAPNGRTQRLTATVPDVADANLHEIAGLPPYEGKPDGQLIIDAAVAAVAPAVAAAEAAEAARDSASGHRLNAHLAQEVAQSAKDAAESAQDAALLAQAGAETAQAASEDARDAAQGSATSAATSAATANARATAAEDAATTAVGAAQTATTKAGEATDGAAAALGAQGAAQTAAAAAQGAQSAAETARTQAQSAATTAAQAALTANGHADAAAEDSAATAADRIQTGADRAQTGLDRAATAADRIATGADALTATQKAALATEQADIAAQKAIDAGTAAGLADQHRIAAESAATAATGAASTATAKAGEAVTSATASSTSAAAAQAAANGAADAVVSQLSAIKTQTEYARDQALDGLGAADNSQILAELVGTLSYAIDVAGQGVRNQAAVQAAVETALAGLAGYDAPIEQQVYALAHALDLIGVIGRAISGGDVIVRAGTTLPPPVSPAGDRDTGLQFPAADVIALLTAGLERLRIDAAGRVGIGTSAPSGLLDVADDKIRIRSPRTPASATASGGQGEIAWDANYVYVCVATNAWRRAPLSTW